MRGLKRLADEDEAKARTKTMPRTEKKRAKATS